jgi:hypothetical protein
MKINLYKSKSFLARLFLSKLPRFLNGRNQEENFTLK